MSATLLPQAVIQFTDANGNPLAGGSVGYYIPATLTPKTTWQDSAQTIPNANPVLLDAAGRAIVWGSGAYRMIVKDALGNTIYDQVTQDANAGLVGNMTDFVWLAGSSYTDPVGSTPGTFVPGTTTTFNLASAPGAIANTWPTINGVAQDDTQGTVSSTAYVFNSPVPLGSTVVQIKVGSTIAVGTPSAGSVVDASVAANAGIQSSKLSFLQAGVGAIPRTVQSRLRDVVNPLDFGADATGATDCTVAFENADGVGAFRVSPGSYLINQDLTISHFVYFEPGAIITIPDGITVTFNGGMSSELNQVFNCTGATPGVVVLNRASQAVAYPEWWGALPGVSSADCSVGINAAHVAAPDLELQAATYFTKNPVLFTTSNRRVRGKTAGAFAENGTIGGTQIALTTSTGDIVVLGASADPGSIGKFGQDIHIQDIGGYRTVPVTPPTAGQEAKAPSGVRWQYALNTSIDRCNFLENSIGLNVSSVIFSFVTRMQSFRRSGGTSSTNDIYWGYFLNGSGPYYIQSLDIEDCASVVEGVPSTVISSGIASVGAFTDINITRLEAGGHMYGGQINGSGATIPSIDNLITGCRFDQSQIFGLIIENQIDGSDFKVSDNYVVINHTGSEIAAYGVSNCVAPVALEHNEAKTFGGSTAVGILVNASPNVVTRDNLLVDFARPVVLQGAASCRIADNIFNESVGATEAAVVLNTSSVGCVIECMINATSALFPQGVSLDSTCSRNEVRCTGINSSSISGGSANKLVYNGTQITAAGSFGTNNLAQGVMV